MSTFTRTLLATSCAAALAGCAVNAQQLAAPTESFPSQLSRAEKRLAEDWPAASVVNSGEPLVVLQTPQTIPSSVQGTRSILAFSPGTTIEAVAAYLGSLGHSVIVADDAAAKKTFYIPHYSGTLGGFLAAVSRATDVWFTWQEGTIIISSEERLAITLPQEAGLAKTIKAGLSSLGDASAATLWEAGMVSVSVKPSTYRRIRAYLERMSQNAAILSINAGVVTLDLNREVKSGVDWESLNVSLGKNLDSEFIQSDPTLPPIAQTDGKIGGTGLNFSVTRGPFKLNALVDFLSKYGNTETRQDLILKSVSGGKVEIKSLVQVPYVKSVSNNGVVSNTNGTNGTNGTTNNGTTATVETAQADDGIEMKVSPNYDAAAGAVALDITLSLKAVLGYNKLSAGNQVGELTQPTTAERKFESSIRMRPGETVVLGGVTYEQLVDRQGRPLFIPDTSQLVRSDVSARKQSIFVVLRPTVTTFGPVKGAEALDWFMEGKVPGGGSQVRGDLRVRPAAPKEPAPAPGQTAQPRSRAEAHVARAQDSQLVKVLVDPAAAGSADEAQHADGVLASARAAARARLQEKEAARRKALARARRQEEAFRAEEAERRARTVSDSPAAPAQPGGAR